MTVRMWRADTVVPFDWLMSTDLNSVPVTHPAQKQALAELLSRFESDTGADLTGPTAEVKGKLTDKRSGPGAAGGANAPSRCGRGGRRWRCRLLVPVTSSR